MKVQSTFPATPRSSSVAKRAGVGRLRHPPQAAWWPEFRQTLRPGLERDTMLMPWVIAGQVCVEVSTFLDVPLPTRCADWLEAVVVKGKS